ncbi:LapA family protein [Rhodococcus hoagii]|nr:LapA family protein [Prescottella equi]
MNDTSTGRKLFEASPRNIAAAALTLVAVIFIVQNRNSAAIDLFWVSVRAPLWVILVAVFAVGWVAGLLTTRRSKNSKK